MNSLEHFQAKWAGCKFRCGETGEEIIIPQDVQYRQFFKVGNGFVDVGDGYYARLGGNIMEIKD